MSLRVRLRSAAEQDVADQALYYQEVSVELALRFLDAFDAAASLIQCSPEIGGNCEFRRPPFDAIRVWPVGGGFKNVLVFYRVLDDEIEFVRVLHGARDLDIVFGEGREQH